MANQSLHPTAAALRFFGHYVSPAAAAGELFRSAAECSMAWDQFWRNAAGRLAFSLGKVPADSYVTMCQTVAAKFGLSPLPGVISNGCDIVFQDYNRGEE